MDNRLGDETSPYLRQHRDNPVHWQPWDPPALASAREQDRPILLSIGYSACHWCHVMAHECFEDAAIAEVMNRHYISIKVDREQRPDLDRIYQLAHQALTGRGGGWPLTVFLTPHDLLPFFAGTYFPPQPRHGLPAFPELLEGVARYYREQRSEIREQNLRMQAFFDQMSKPEAAAADEPQRQLWRNGLAAMAQGFDPVHGGHRGGPKFPAAGEARLWLRALASSGDAAHPRAAVVLRTSLDGMARHGLYDHLGGGFFRYCVDDAWTIPHFEKMLYDNAQLLPVYAEAALAFAGVGGVSGTDTAASADWLAVVAGTVTFLERELRDPAGGLYCALDADSPDGEGAYYVWSPAQVTAALATPTAAHFIQRYGLDGPANFEEQYWHLSLASGEHIDQRDPDLVQAHAKLLALRRQRPAPGLDDKVLTAWNALAIAGLSRSARALDTLAGLATTVAVPAWSPEALTALAARCDGLADAALEALHRDAWRDGRLYADREARFPAWLDDHAFLLDALIERLQRRWRGRDGQWAGALAETLLERFEDRDHGGFWFSAHDHEPLPQRPRPWTDDAIPSGNGVAIRALLVLSQLFGVTHWRVAAERALRAALPNLERHPQACASLLLALDEYLDPGAQLIVRVDDSGELEAWNTALAQAAVGHRRVFRIVGDPTPLPAVLSAERGHSGAWLCRLGTCSAPMPSPEDLVAGILADASR